MAYLIRFIQIDKIKVNGLRALISHFIFSSLFHPCFRSKVFTEKKMKSFFNLIKIKTLFSILYTHITLKTVMKYFDLFIKHI